SPACRPSHAHTPPVSLTCRSSKWANAVRTWPVPAPPPLRIDPVQHPRERDHLPDVRPAGDPGDRALDAEPEAGVWEGPVLPEVEVPAVAVLGQALLADALEQRSEEHTSELQSRENLVCRLLLEKKKK